MLPENSQGANSSEDSNPSESETAPAQKSGELTQPPEVEAVRAGVELINPALLISRQIPSEMSGSKVKRLKKKIREKGFDPLLPIEVADVDGKLIILDVHHRAAAARQLAMKLVPIERRKVSRSQEELLLQEAAEAEIYRQY